MICDEYFLLTFNTISFSNLFKYFTKKKPMKSPNNIQSLVASSIQAQQKTIQPVSQQLTKYFTIKTKIILHQNALKRYEPQSPGTNDFQLVLVLDYHQTQPLIFQKLQISSFPNLKSLQLRDCQQLKSLQFLAHLDSPFLDSIMIENCQHISSLQPLKNLNLKYLEEIQIQNIKTGSYEGLHRMKLQTNCNLFKFYIRKTKILDMNFIFKMEIVEKSKNKNKIQKIHFLLTYLVLISEITTNAEFGEFQSNQIDGLYNKVKRMLEKK